MDKKACCEGIIENIPDESVVKGQASYFKALSDPARIKLVYALSGGERCVCELMSTLKMSQTLVSHHLKILKGEGIIEDRKEGKWVYYSLIDDDAMLLIRSIEHRG